MDVVWLSVAVPVSVTRWRVHTESVSPDWAPDAWTLHDDGGSTSPMPSHTEGSSGDPDKECSGESVILPGVVSILELRLPWLPSPGPVWLLGYIPVSLSSVTLSPGLSSRVASGCRYLVFWCAFNRSAISWDRNKIHFRSLYSRLRSVVCTTM